jgi:glucosamine 6-phosphate synthetase-like amidotransferase/phosphosugar isomerase protein
MCQLTYLHGYTDIVQAYLMNLTLLNASNGNKDGHGYFLFPNSIWKSKEDEQSLIVESDYFDRLDKMVGDQKIISIMSHVRSASRGFEVTDENAHPFKLGHLILIHNGTLEAEDKKDEITGKIDSYWFLKKLDYIVGKSKLTPEHIAEASKAFKGKFAFLIHDLLQPNILFIAKGKADLYYARSVNDKKEQILFVINTSKRSLQVCLVDVFYRIFFKSDIIMDEPKAFDDESIYIYNILTSELNKTKVKIEEKPIYITCESDFSGYMGFRGSLHQGINVPINSHTGHYIDTANDRAIVSNIIEHSNNLGLCFSEINALTQHITGNSIIFCDDDDAEITINALKWLEKDCAVTNKIDLWRDIKKLAKGIAIDTYRDYKIQFPWSINSKNGLKHALNRVQKRNNNRTGLST